MKRNEDFRKALGQPDEYFRQSVIDTLDQLNRQAEKESRPQRRYTTRIIASFAAMVLLVAGVILNRQYIPGISQDGHVDTINPTPTIATQLTKSSSVVETDLATLSIRNTGIDENTVYVSVEVMPRKKKSLALNWSIKPYSDSVTTIGKTPDYEGQTVMGWARKHDYEELIRVVFSNAFEPLTPGVVDASLDHRTGPVPDPAFDSICINHSEYEDNGATVIDVTGNSLPDTKEYMLGFVLQVWDMTLKDHEVHDSAFSSDPQIFGNIPFTIGEPEEPEVIAEYKPVSNPENTNTTLVLLKTSYSDFYEIRTNIASYIQEYTGTSIFEYDNCLPSPISVSITTGTEIKPEESNGTYIFRRACDINDVPEKLSLFLKSGQMQEFILTSSPTGTSVGNSSAEKAIPDIPPVEEYSAQAWAVTAESLSDLYGNPEARIGQVYCVKGFVENTFLDDHPGRVIINAGENGEYLPVCVECPWYRDFTWEPGTYYQIYADVTSIEGNMPILTARYSYAQSKRNTLETDLATVTFRDAVIQNYEIHLSFDVRPKHENCFVYDSQHQLSSRCKYVSDFYGIQADDPEQTLSQWVKEHGYEELMHVSIAPPNNGEYGSFRTESYQRMDDGSVRMTIVGPALSDSLVYDIEWDAIDYKTGRTNYQSESQIMHLDLSETGVTTLPSAETPSVQTELADLTIQKAVYGDHGVYVNVEVVPKQENCLILNSSIDPYADSPEKIDKTSDYEGQSIMKWAAEHGQKVVRLRIGPAFDKEPPMEPDVIYTIPAPAFSADIEEHVEYRDDGSSVIRVVGIAVPNQQVYRLQFIMHEMDMSKAYNFTSDTHGKFTLIDDSQTIATLAFTVSDLDEEPQVLAEYKSQPDPDQAGPEPEITVTLLHTSFYDCYDVRIPDELHALTNDIYGKEHNYFPFLKKVGSPYAFGEQGYISTNQAVTKEDGAYIYRCIWIFPDELPDSLVVDNGVFRRTLVRVK